MSVAAIQRALISRGHDIGAGGPSGRGDDDDLGPLTRAALMEFQRSEGLPASGRIDVATAAALRLHETPEIEPAQAPAPKRKRTS